MGAKEKNANENLSRIAADLFVKTKGGEELSSKIRRLRDEIKKVIESDDTLFGKFRGLVESFREIIPEEKQRYSAAIKALSTTSKVSQQDIVKAVNNQIEELKILEKGLLSTPSAWRDELKVMEAKSREMRDEISKLRERIGRLESEEKEILNGMAAREEDMELVSKAVGELFTDIAEEIANINKKVQEVTAENAASQPSPPQSIPPQPIPLGDSIKSDILREEKGGTEQKGEILESSAQQQDTEFQKKCPMCGGRMDFLSNDKMWRCYSCAYEELNGEKGGGEQKSEIPAPSAPQQDTEFQKKCPMCGGRMNFHNNEKMWMCYSCAYEESEKGDVHSKSEEKSEHANAPKPTTVLDPILDPSPPRTVSLASSSSNQEPIKGSIQRSSLPKKPSHKKKTCPACSKKMNWYPEEKAWRCPFCDYERRI